ncbi:MAG: host attachment protein [Xanthomonadaceae bacterium]|nr:host attachment protein [Xanthomonadaceae bacterium]
MKNSRWYILANQADAVFYESKSNHKDFQYILRLTNNYGRKHEGRMDGSRTLHYAVGSQDAKLGHYSRKFARKIAEVLYLSHQKGLCNKVTIVASPHFLGVLRKELHSSIKQALVKEIKTELIEKVA